MAWEMRLNDKLLEELYLWIDSLQLTRSKKRIERDFSDGVLAAEVVHYYLPDLIDLHNYNAANSLEHKKSNWATLNRKVLTNFGLELSDVIIAGLANGKPELRGKSIQQESTSTSRKTSLSNVSSTTNIGNNKSSTNKNVSRFDFEEVKQQYLDQQEQIEVLQAKLRRLEHLLKLKDQRIDELSNILKTDQIIKSNR